jgi:transposase
MNTTLDYDSVVLLVGATEPGTALAEPATADTAAEPVMDEPVMDERRADRTRPAPRVRRADRTQRDPLPRTIDELVPLDHQVRAVQQIVDEMDVTALEEQIKAVEGHPGRPPIDVRILVALWLYGTIDQVSSARRLDEQCRHHDVYKWICGGVPVNYHTVSDFRVRHSDWLEKQIVVHVAALQSEGLVTLQTAVFARPIMYNLSLISIRWWWWR